MLSDTVHVSGMHARIRYHSTVTLSTQCHLHLSITFHILCGYSAVAKHHTLRAKSIESAWESTADGRA